MNDESRAVSLSRSDRRAFSAQLEEGDFYYVHENEAAESQRAIDLRAIWSALYRNRYLILAVLAVSLLAGLAVSLLTTPVYRATTTIQIDQQSAKVLDTQDVEPVVAPQEAERFLQTQLDILRSRSLATRVAGTMGLFGNDKFLTNMKATPVEGATSGNGAQEQREQVLKILKENLSVELPRNSRVAQISFDSPDRAMSAEIANNFAKNFILSNLQRRFDTSNYSREFLQGQLAETKRRLEDSERAIIDYARSAQLIDASAGAPGADGAVGPRSLTTSNLVQLNQAYSAARSARVQAQQRWAQAQATPLMSLPEVLTNKAIQDLTQRRAELRAQYQEERARRKEDHPAVKQAAAELSELDDQINKLAVSIRQSIGDQFLVTQRQEQALQGNVGQLKTETLAEQDRSVRYNILRREVDTNRAMYDGLLQRYKEVSAAAGITSNNITIIDSADPPIKPVAPRPLLNLALAGLAGIALALMLVFIREQLDDAIRDPDDIERKLALPLMGVLPLLPPRTEPRDALADPRSPLSEAYHGLRASLELSSSSGLPGSLLLTSSRQSEGKSTTAYAIARDLARGDKRVLLVDADLRRPSLHNIVGTANETGLSNLLARQKRSTEVVQETDVANLDFISSGPLPPNPAELLAGSSMADLLTELGNTYQIVVIDGPPVLGLADALRLSAVAEATIFVIEANAAHRGHAKNAVRRLMAAHARMLGAVLTKFDARKIGLGYGYDYTYEYQSDGHHALADGGVWKAA